MEFVARGALALLGAAAIWLALLALGSASTVALPAVRSTALSKPLSDSFPVESIAALARHNPFRLTRDAAPLPYDPAGPPLTAEPPAPGMPAPILTGIVWGGGREPGAVVEGLLGIDGPRVLRAGDTIAGLSVRRIGPGDVVIVGHDTGWTLRVREPW